jgi:hypothetical protein
MSEWFPKKAMCLKFLLPLKNWLAGNNIKAGKNKIGIEELITDSASISVYLSI